MARRDRNQQDEEEVPDRDEVAQHDAGNGMAAAASFGILLGETESENTKYQCDRAKDEADAGDQGEHAAVISCQGSAVLVWDEYGDAVDFIVFTATAPPGLLVLVVLRLRATAAMILIRTRAAGWPRAVFLEGFVSRFGHWQAPPTSSVG